MLLISPIYRVFKCEKRYFHPKQNIEKSSVADLHPSKLFEARSTFAAFFALRFSLGSVSIASSFRASSRRGAREHLSATHRGTSQGRAVFPCRRNGT